VNDDITRDPGASPFVTDMVLWAAAGLGVFSIVMAVAATYFVVRRQGVFYKAQVRSTHPGALENEPADH
jgi:hypothetical protein